MTSPFTEIIYKLNTKYERNKINFIYHPIDLRDKLRLTVIHDHYSRDLPRSEYSRVVAKGLVLVHYEE